MGARLMYVRGIEQVNHRGPHSQVNGSGDGTGWVADVQGVYDLDDADLERVVAEIILERGFERHVRSVSRW